MKSLKCIPGIILVLILASSCYRQAPIPTPEPLAIELQLDKPIYQAGEFIVLTVRANEACYLALYDTSTKGEVTQIFPNHYASDNLIEGARIYRIPSQADQFDYEVTGPPGMERVRAVCTLQNVNLVNTTRSTSQETFPKIQQSPDQFEKTLDRKLQTMPTGQWAEASATFQVQ